jgi:hypothetical protein
MMIASNPHSVETLARCFLSPEEIPPAFRMGTCREERLYLLDKFVKLIDPLANQVCRINLNAQCQRGPDTLPFTGRKDSAEATLSISDALRCFSIRSLVAARSNPESRDIIQEIVTRRHSNFLRTGFIL